jgi:hypothetical protein
MLTLQSNPVSTVVGEIDRTQLDLRPMLAEDQNTVVCALEWHYIGGDQAVLAKIAEHTEKSGQPFVRRDAWVVVKCGQAVEGLFPE